MLEGQLARSVYEKAGIKIEDLPKGVFIEWRNGFYVAVNYTDLDFKVPIPSEGRILVGSNLLKPAQTIVWTTKK